MPIPCDVIAVILRPVLGGFATVFFRPALSGFPVEIKSSFNSSDSCSLSLRLTLSFL